MQPWEQQPGEPDKAYTHFLCYRDFGPERSLEKAYQSTLPVRTNAEGGIVERNKRQQASGAWSKESSRWNWSARAHAWDLHQFSTYGRNTVFAYVRLVHGMVSREMTTLDDPALKPSAWKEFQETVESIAKLIPSASVDALLRAGNNGPEPAGEPADKADSDPGSVGSQIPAGQE
jgi:hypothetical protein